MAAMFEFNPRTPVTTNIGANYHANDADSTAPDYVLWNGASRAPHLSFAQHNNLL